jgi:hypothetical protein
LIRAKKRFVARVVGTGDEPKASKVSAKFFLIVQKLQNARIKGWDGGFGRKNQKQESRGTVPSSMYL